MRISDKTPTVSVIIPTYNRAHLIGHSIQSVLNQTYGDFEIIVVDDGSTDNTEEIVKSFNDERIVYIKNETNKGGGAARNTGIKVTKGKYIAFQDSDDEWLPEKLEKQMEIFQTAQPETGVVYTGFYLIKNNKRIYIPSAKINPKEGNIFSSLIKKSFITTPAVLVKKECFEQSGTFDESLPRLQDWDLFIRIAKHYHFKYVNEPLVISYYTQDSVSANASTLKAREVILLKHLEDIGKHRKLLADYYFHIGAASYSNGKISQGRMYLIKAAKIYPLDIRYLGAASATLLGRRIYNIFATSYRKMID